MFDPHHVDLADFVRVEQIQLLLRLHVLLRALDQLTNVLLAAESGIYCLPFS